MGLSWISWKKTVEVYREDGKSDFLKSAIRYLYGLVQFFYLRNIRGKSEAVLLIQGYKMIINVFT